jgi:hypothetical protein
MVVQVFVGPWMPERFFLNTYGVSGPLCTVIVFILYQKHSVQEYAFV